MASSTTFKPYSVFSTKIPIKIKPSEPAKPALSVKRHHPSLFKKLIYGFTAALGFSVLGSAACEQTLGMVTHGRFPQYGNYCEKPYVSGCLTRTVFTNDLHYYGELPKSTDSTICVFGGSTSFSPVGPDNYARQLESILENTPECANKRVRTINTSMYGYDLHDIEGQTRNELGQLECDIALVSEQYNGLYRPAILGTSDRPNGIKEHVQRYLPFGSLIHLALLPSTISKAGHEEVDIEPYVQEYQRVLSKIHTNTNNAGVKLVLGIHPDNLDHTPEMSDSFYDNAGVRVRILSPTATRLFKKRVAPLIREYAMANGLQLIDWKTAFNDRVKLGDYFQPDQIHPNSEGALKMAEYAAEQLKRDVCGSPEPLLAFSEH